jgi:hypothetical protein
MRSVVALMLCLVAAAPCQAAAAALITILEGPAQVIRGSAWASAALGLALEEGDIVQTGPGASLLRIEFADQVMLDLGPATRVLLRPPPAARGGARQAQAYVLTGFAKLSAPASGAAQQAMPGGVLMSPQLEVLTDKVCVLDIASATAGAAEKRSVVFAESGDSRVRARGGVMLALKAGQLALAGEGQTARLRDRPTPDWLQGVPAALRDSLPARAALVATAKSSFKAQSEVSYDDVHPWLHAEPALRNALLPRWKLRAHDPAFRAALLKQMRLHPEWDRVLFPEKYRPKRAASAAA